MYVCLLVSLFACTFVCLHVYARLFVCLPVYVCSFVFLCGCMFVCLPVRWVHDITVDLLEKGMILAHLCGLIMTDVVVFLQKYDQLFAVAKERQEGDEHTAETEEIPLGGTADSLVQIP